MVQVTLLLGEEVGHKFFIQYNNATLRGRTFPKYVESLNVCTVPAKFQYTSIASVFGSSEFSDQIPIHWTAGSTPLSTVIVVAFCQLPKPRPLSTPLPLSHHRINSQRRSGVPLVPSAGIHPIGQVVELNAEIVPIGTLSMLLYIISPVELNQTIA